MASWGGLGSAEGSRTGASGAPFESSAGPSLSSAENTLARLQCTVPQLSARDLASSDLLHSAVIFDIRDPLDAAEGTLPHARLLSQGSIEFEVRELGLAPEQSIVVACHSGRNSLVAAKVLMDLGYRHVLSLQGGFQAWKDAGLRVAKPVVLDEAEQRRYSRHLALPQVGEAGQLKLKRARVAIVGLGGLGSAAAIYLAAAGVGYLRLIDDETLEDSHLQRQVVHSTLTIGQPKVASARNRLLELNPHVEVQALAQRLTAGHAAELLAGVDVVLDGAGDFETRHVVNEAALHNRQVVVSAGLFQFSGQLSVFAPHLNQPCYACLYPDRPPGELAPSFLQAGMLGALAGVVGTMQAMEALKLILEIGRPLFSKLLVYDGLTATTRHLNFNRRADCPTCGAEAVKARTRQPAMEAETA